MGRKEAPVASTKEFEIPANQKWWRRRQAILGARSIDNGIQGFTRYAVAPFAKGNIAHNLNAASKGVSIEDQIESQNSSAIWQ
jgi:hypothetical protein